MRKWLVFFLVIFMVSGTALAQDSQGQSIPIVVAPDVFDRAGTALDAGDYEQAIIDYSLFILLNPTFSQAYYLRGFAYLQLGDETTALNDLEQALQYPAPSADLTANIYRIQTLIYWERDDLEIALETVSEGIEAAPESATLYFIRGELLSDMEQYEDALTDLDEAIRLQPADFPDFYRSRGAVNVLLGNLDDALNDYSTLLEISPDDVAAHNDRALIHVQQENYEAALIDLDAAIQMEDSIAGLYLQRGFVNTQLSNQTDAASDYLQYIRLQNTNVNSDNVLRPGESLVLEMETGTAFVLGFEGTVGQKVTVTATARPGQDTDPLIVLMDVEGMPLVGDDDSGGDYNAQIENYALPADGVYAVVLHHAGGGSNGPVRVLLQFVD
ncbi:MAG: tetratricopeptide repeat protein [Anaerolineae bacterium]|nr:tetratricopeptide repeat protein [Anaerolineae bacterium]